MRSYARRLTVVAALLVVCASALSGQGSNVAQLYTEAKARETALRSELDALKDPARGAGLLGRMRVLMGTYEDIARLFPTSGYSDNALWQGGLLAADAYWQFGDRADLARALRLLNALTQRYPTSSRVKEVPPYLARLNAAAAAPAPGDQAAPPPVASAARPVQTTAGTSRFATLQAIRRDVLPEVLRITIELGRETPFRDERIEGPSRVFIDMQDTRAIRTLDGATIAYPDDVVRQVRVGRQLDGRTRVVFDLAGAPSHSIYALYNPFRIVVDFERADRSPRPADLRVAVSDVRQPAPNTASPQPVVQQPAQAPAVAAGPDEPASSGRTPPTASSGEPRPIAPAEPNSQGGLSLSRQLGLGIAKIVIDPGHGGHDPGAQIKGANEADLVLDVATRLEKLLLRQPGVEVVLTRRTNVYIPLEERTAIANREEADLFLSIHVNASDDPRARGVETYFLNFAPNKQAEAIAARENAGSARTMRSLPEIVTAITLSDKIEESRDFAAMVQGAMVERLRKANRVSRNLGVKQAPFVVLIGATMPSVLAELPFITNRQEGTWLKGAAYRQQLAEALLNGIMRYQQSLKGTQIAATGTR